MEEKKDTTVIKCNLCTKFSINKSELDNIKLEESKIKQFLKTIKTPIGFKKEKIESKLKTKEDLIMQHIKGKIMSHLSIKHLSYVLKNFPKFRKSKKSWEAIKKSFYFNWDELNEYGIEE